MPKVKILFTAFSDSDLDYAGASEIIGRGLDWEDITDEEYKFLSANISRIPAPEHMHVRLVVADTLPVKARIEGIRQWIVQQQQRDAEARAARLKKQQERRAKKLKDLADELGMVVVTPQETPHA